MQTIARAGRIAGLNRSSDLGSPSEFFRSFGASKPSVRSSPLTRFMRDVRAKDIDRATTAEKAELYYSASHKPFCGAATKTIGPVRHVDRPSRPKCARRHLRFWRYHRRGVTRFRRSISGGVARAGRAIDRSVARTRGSVVPSRGLIRTTPIVRNDS